MPTLQAYAQGLLDCAVVTLAEGDAPVCKSFLAPGPTPAMDDCCECSNGGEGSLWVSYVTSEAVNPFYGQPCGRQFTVTFRIGLTRCAHTVTESGVPTAAELDADAAKIYRDRRLLLKAVTCCWADETFDLDPGEWAIGTGQVLPVQGGCLGQTLEVLLRTSECSDCL